MTGSAARWPAPRSSTGWTITLSRFSYLVSLLPQQIIDDLGLDLELRSRRIASYTPVGDGGLLVERQPGEATRDSFAAGPGLAAYAAFQALEAELHRFATVVAPTLTAPLPRAADVRDAVGDELWRDLVRAADRRADRAYGRRRHRPRHPAHRRPDRHLRQRPLPGARAEPLLPLPRGRQRHRGVEGAGRRDGHGGGGAGGRRLVRRAPSCGPAPRSSDCEPYDGGVTVRLADGEVITARTVLANCAPVTLAGLLGESGGATGGRPGQDQHRAPAAAGVPLRDRSRDRVRRDPAPPPGLRRSSQQAYADGGVRTDPRSAALRELLPLADRPVDRGARRCASRVSTP